MATSAQQTWPRYDRLRFVLGQGDEGESAIVRDSLHAQGVQRVADCNGSADRLFAALDSEIVDLLVYDSDMHRERFVEVMQFVRRKARGRNPFVIIVATVNDSSTETVRRLVRAGVDDLIRKPVTGERLFDSVGKFMRGRKPFLVTHDYVGPSRRLDGRPEPPDKELLIQAPNTMRSRAIDGVSEAEVERIVEAAVANLRDKQLIACGARVDVLARRLLGSRKAAKGMIEGGEDAPATLDRIEAVAADLRDRCRGTPFERVGDLAKMVLALIDRIDRGSVSRATVEIQLLAKLAEAIHRALTVEREASQTIRDIAATIGHYTGEKH